MNDIIANATAYTAFLLRVFGVTAIGVSLEVAYRHAIQRCEAKIINRYSIRFEGIIFVATSVHPHLIQSIELSRAAVDRARRKEVGETEIIAALTQASEKLKEAEEDCNRALQALQLPSEDL